MKMIAVPYVRNIKDKQIVIKYLVSEGNNEEINYAVNNVFEKILSDPSMKKFKYSKTNYGGIGISLSLDINLVPLYIKGKGLDRLFSYFQEENISVPQIRKNGENDMTPCLENSIKVVLNDIPRPEIVKSVQLKADEIINDVFVKYNNPEVKRAIDAMVNINGNSDFKNAILSPKNRVLIYAQKPDATYCDTYNGWLRFGRIVMPNATPIFIIAGDNESHSDVADMNSAFSSEEAHGNVHMQKDRKWGGFVPSEIEHTRWITYYDYSDTTSLGGEDKFSDMGLESNLTGNLNAKALETRGDVEIDDDAKLSANEINSQKIYNFLTNLSNTNDEYRKLGIILAGKEPSDESALFNATISYFETLLERNHNDTERKRQATLCASVCLFHLDVAPNYAANGIKNSNGDNNKKVLANLWYLCSSFLGDINSMIKESVGSDFSFEEFLSILGIREEDLYDNMNESLVRVNNNFRKWMKIL